MVYVMQKSLDLFKNKISVTLIALFCVLLWGSAFPAVKTGYQWFAIEGTDISSKLLFAGIRFFGAGILDLLLAVIVHRKFALPGRNYLKAVGMLGLVQTFFQYVFFYIALANMTGAKGSVVNAMGTFLTVILAHFLCDNDKMNKQKVVGCILGIAGVILINMNGDMGALFALSGDGLMILAAVAFALGNIISKKVSGGLDAMWLTGYQLVFGGGLLILSGVLTGGHLTVITAKGMLLMLYMSFLSAAAFTLWLMLLKNNPVGKISMFSALIPVFGTLLSGIVLGENVFNMTSLVSLICVAAGIYIINRGKG